VQTSENLTQQLVDLMTTNETLWFRDQTCWNSLTDQIVPEMIRRLDQGQEQIRIWSAASSTGQESYSLMILIEELLQGQSKMDYRNRFEIVGTDISLSAVQAAKAGVYDHFTIARGLSEERRNKYFTLKGKNSYAIKPERMAGVTFQEFNLMNSFSTLGKFDLILCRNVLIYFSDATKVELLKRLKRSLLPKGNMILGATESTFGMDLDYQTQTYRGGLYYTH